MTKTLLILTLLLGIVTYSYSQSDLQLIQSKDQIFIFANPKSGKQIIEYKAHTFINNTSLDQVLRMFSKYGQHSDWVYNCEKSELVNQDRNAVYLYQVCNASWPFRNRDYILELKKTQKDSTTTKISFSAVNDLVPTKKNLVRLDYFKGYWLLQQIGSNVKVSMHCEFDPNLSMPRAMRKAYAIKIPFNTLRNLRAAFK